MKMDQPASCSAYLHQCKAPWVAFTNFLGMLWVVKYPIRFFLCSFTASFLRLFKNQKTTAIMFLVIIMAFHEINLIYYTRIRRQRYVLCYLISHLIAFLTRCISAFQSVFYVLCWHEFFSIFSFYYFHVWTGCVTQEPASFLFGQYHPTCMQFYGKRDGAGLHQEYLVLIYPLVTQTVLLARHSLLWNKRLFISRPAHRLWLMLPRGMLIQSRERGLGGLGK